LPAPEQRIHNLSARKRTQREEIDRRKEKTRPTGGTQRMGSEVVTRRHIFHQACDPLDEERILILRRASDDVTEPGADNETDDRKGKTHDRPPEGDVEERARIDTDVGGARHHAERAERRKYGRGNKKR